MRKSYIFVLVVSIIVLSGCGAGSSDTDTISNQLNSINTIVDKETISSSAKKSEISNIVGEVPGTLIEAFCDNDKYYSTNSIDNGTTKHPFLLKIPKNQKCRFVMIMYPNDDTKKIIIPIEFIDKNYHLQGIVVELLQDNIDFGYIDLPRSLDKNSDKDGDRVLDKPLKVLLIDKGAKVVLYLNDPLDVDSDGIINRYDSNKNDGELNDDNKSSITKDDSKSIAVKDSNKTKSDKNITDNNSNPNNDINNSYSTTSDQYYNTSKLDSSNSVTSNTNVSDVNITTNKESNKTDVISIFVGDEFEKVALKDQIRDGEFRLKNAPDGMSIIPTTGIITWTPSKLQVGDYNISAILYRNNKLVASEDYNIIVKSKVILYNGYFVDPNLPSNKNATGSVDDPFTSFKDACSVAKGGDNLYLRGGIYYSKSFNSGSINNGAFIKVIGCEGEKNNHIMIRPWGNELVKILTDGYSGISIYNSRYLTVQSLEIEGVSKQIDINEDAKEWWYSNKYYNGGGISIVKSNDGDVTHDITVRDCIVHDVPAGGIKGYNATHIVIKNNIVYNTNWWTTKGTTAVGIILAPELDEEDDSKHYNQIVGNLLFGTEQRVFSRDWPKSATNFVIDEGEAILIQEGMRTASDTDGSERTGYSARYLIKDNLVVYNGKGIISNLVDKVDIYNNTLYMNGTTSISPFTGLSSAGFNINSSDDVNLVKNIVKSKSDGITIWYSSTTTNLNKSENHFSGHFLNNSNIDYNGITKYDDKKLLKDPINDDYNPIDEISSSGATVDGIVEKAKRYGIHIKATGYKSDNKKLIQMILDAIPDDVEILGYDNNSSDKYSYLYIKFDDEHPHTVATGDNNYTLELPKVYLDGINIPKPTISISGNPKEQLNEYDSYYFKPDTNGSNLTFFIKNKPSWADFNKSSGVLSGIAVGDGDYSDIIIGADNGINQVEMKPFTITVNPAQNLAFIYGDAVQPLKNAYPYYIEPTKAIDDDNNTYNHTQGDSKLNWWELKLPKNTLIRRVVVINRQDYPSRLDGAKMYIRQMSIDSNISNLQDSEVVKILQGVTDPQIWDNSNNLKGSYIVIKAKDDNNLHMAELEVYGTLPQEPQFDKDNYYIAIKPDSNGEVTKIIAKDYQNDEITYSIDGENGFSIDSDGVVYIDNSKLEDKDSFELNITANDGLHSSITTLHIINNLGCNGVNIYRYNNIEGDKVSDYLESDRVDGDPDAMGIVPNIDYYQNKSDNFALKYETILKIDEGGNYKFAIVGDDETMLEIYTMDRKKIVSIKGPAWAGYKNWSKASTTEYINMKEGEIFHIVAYLKEKSGAEHIALGWKEEAQYEYSTIPNSLLYIVNDSPDDCSKSCIDGLEYKLLTPTSLYGNYGTVMSSTEYINNESDTYNPQKIEIKTTKDSIAYIGCKFTYTPYDNSGWIYDKNVITDDSGIASSIWVAGENSGIQRLNIASDNGYSTILEAQGKSGNKVRTDSIHLRYSVSSYNKFTISTHPISIDSTTYFSLLNWTGSYMGIQFDGDVTKVIFSTWDTNDGKKAKIIDTGDSNEQVGFGGEGTGVSVRLIFPPSQNGHIDGLPDDYMLQNDGHYKMTLKVIYPNDCQEADNCTDFEVDFYDLDNNYGPIRLGTLRYQARVTPYYASSFVEDWYAYSGDTCLNSGRRAVEYYDIAYLDANTNEWVDVTKGNFFTVYKPENNEICVNYAAYGIDNGFLMSSGGSDTKYMQEPLIWSYSKEIEVK